MEKQLVLLLSSLLLNSKNAFPMSPAYPFGEQVLDTFVLRELSTKLI